jgi:hypothetical protein
VIIPVSAAEMQFAGKVPCQQIAYHEGPGMAFMERYSILLW